MSIRYGNKVGPLISRKPSFFKKDRFDNSRIKTPTSPSAWQRPSDWLTMPTITPSEQKIALLMPVFPQGSNFLAFRVSGNYTVDWGDGVTENFTGPSTAQHEYSYTDPDLNPTVTSDGFKMAIVTITPQAGQNITSINFNQKYTLSGSTFPDSSPILEIALSCPFLTSISLGSNASVFCKSLVSFNGVNMGSVVDFSYLFSFLYALKNVTFGTIAAVNNAFAMFQGCTSLIAAPFFNTSAVTTMQNMFNGCNSLTFVPQFNTAAVTSMAAMFLDCSALKYVPLFNTANVVFMQNMFGGCWSLITVPLFNTSAVTNMGGMFSSCLSLTSVPLFNTTAVTSMGSMFIGCASLKSVPLFNTAAVISMSSMLNSCPNLTSVPLFNTASVTDMSSMFSGCRSLTSVPPFNTAAVTNMFQMFQSCNSLISVPLFNTTAVTNMNSMFDGCRSLISVPLFNTAAVTNMSFMFQGCASLKSVPLFNTAAVLNMIAMFQNCRSLISVPLFNTVAVTSMSSMFVGCLSLTSVPLFNTAAVTNMGSMFQNCSSLTSIPLLISGAGTATGKFTGIFNGCVSLTRGALNGSEYTISYSGCKLSKEELESIFNYLDTIGAASQTITVTNNWGAPTPVTLTGTTTTGSITITMANTTGIQVGMQVTGTPSPLTTAAAVTFTDAGDFVNFTNSGFTEGEEVSFATITSTTGIVTNRIYYARNVTSAGFQLSDTYLGTPITLTTNGSGTMRYRTEVISINPNVSITVSRPMTSSGTNSLTFRQLRTGTALLKGWTVTT